MREGIPGNYYAPGNSAAIEAVAREHADDAIDIRANDDNSLIRTLSKGEYKTGTVLPNLAVELSISDGALFEPHDNTFRWRSSRTGGLSLLSKAEAHPVIAFASVVALPLVLWWLITMVIPNMADSLVPFLPEHVVKEASEQSFAILEKSMLDESKLPGNVKNRINEAWQAALEQLALPKESYRLHFRASKTLGANALALPDDAIVVTDDLVLLLAEKEDALLAVLLHETGHIEHQHGLKLVARSVATSIFFAIFFSDIEGAGELVIGASASLLGSAFSRDMEREADAYAIEKLEALGKSPEAFAEAMESFLTLNGDSEHPLTKYLRSHPGPRERIESAGTNEAGQ